MEKNDLDLQMIFEDLPAQGSKKVAIIIGRFNPPTRGHYEVFDTVKKFIRENKIIGLETLPIVMVIGGNKSDADLKKNPLSVDDRITFMKASGHANGITFLTASNAFEALKSVREKGLEPIAVAAGSDRIDDYIKMLDKYFKTSAGGNIKHYRIELHRDEGAVEQNLTDKKTEMDRVLSTMKKGDEVDIGSISASLARRAVELGYLEEFADIVGLDGNMPVAKAMFNKIKKSLSSTVESEK